MFWKNGVAVIGCRHNTHEFIDSLLAAGLPVAGILTLNESAAEKNLVPSWRDLHKIYGQKIPVYVAESYKLEAESDRHILRQTSADVGFCIGWQRILPDWFLATFRNGVFGMHACQHPLPNGRGRSPINWSLIEGAESLHAHIFRYESGADEGSLLSVTKFDITPHDDIDTLQNKCRVVFSRIAVEKWRELTECTPCLFGQDKTQPDRFYPKRTADDGEIDWSWTCRRIHDWVRAQTRPYPGAFAVIGDRRHAVWKCVPVRMPFYDGVTPATVVEKFSDGTLFIKAGDGAVHILDHELPPTLAIGDRLTC